MWQWDAKILRQLPHLGLISSAACKGGKPVFLWPAALQSVDLPGIILGLQQVQPLGQVSDHQDLRVLTAKVAIA